MWWKWKIEHQAPGKTVILPGLLRYQRTLEFENIVMMKNIFIALAFPVLIFSCGDNNADSEVEDRQQPTEYQPSAAADSAFQSLQEIYWNADDSLYLSSDLGNRDLNYWWQAHAIDAQVDAYERTGDEEIMEQIGKHLVGIKRENGGLINDFYDDMSWMGLALLRAYDNSEDPRFLEDVEVLWDDIIQGWNDHHGGGIAWNKNQLDYKNTPTSATAAILAFRLYRMRDQEEDVEMGKDLIEWVDEHLVDHETGTVYDGIGREGDDQIDKDWLFTYNHGVYVGACLEYYDLTDDESWLEKATMAADYATSSLLVSDSEILQDEGQGDGGLFKGILIRYLALLAEHEDVDEEQRTRYRDFIRHNAQSLWEAGSSGQSPYRFNYNWLETPDEEIDLSTQLSGVFLMEAASAMD